MLPAPQTLRSTASANHFEPNKSGVSRDIRGSCRENRVKIQASEMEEDVTPEGLVAAMPSGLYPHRLDASVEAFGVGVGLFEPEDVQDPLHACDDQIRHLLHGVQL